MTSVLPKGTIDVALSRLWPEADPYIDDPVGWSSKKGWFLWSKQQEILQSVRDNRFTAVKACHGPGKSFSASIAAGWWIDVHELGSAFVVTTAPTWPQIEAILWREFRRRHRQGKLPGRITGDCQWHMGETKSDEEMVAMGRKPQDYNEQAFQGIHARYILIILDEACGVPKPLWDAAMTLATNEFARILAIGNPDDPASEFFDKCKPGSDWNVITISAYDTPNFTGEPIPEGLKYDLVSKIWVEERRKEWGEGSPLWVSKIMGEFPEVTDDTLFPPALINRAVANELPGLEHGVYGADLATFGADESTLYRNRGGQVRIIDRWAKQDTMQSAGRLANHLLKHGPRFVPMVIDAIGVGAGPSDRLREQNFPVTPFIGSEQAFRKDRFKNRRAEVYWHFRELMEADLIDLDPEDEQLQSQLGSIKFWIDSAGRIVLESKDDMRKRGLPSPNRADAAVYSTVLPYSSLSELLAANGGSLTGDLMGKVM